MFMAVLFGLVFGSKVEMMVKYVWSGFVFEAWVEKGQSEEEQERLMKKMSLCV